LISSFDGEAPETSISRKELARSVREGRLPCLSVTASVEGGSMGRLDEKENEPIGPNGLE